MHLHLDGSRLNPLTTSAVASTSASVPCAAPYDARRFKTAAALSNAAPQAPRQTVGEVLPALLLPQGFVHVGVDLHKRGGGGGGGGGGARGGSSSSSSSGSSKGGSSGTSSSPQSNANPKGTTTNSGTGAVVGAGVIAGSGSQSGNATGAAHGLFVNPWRILGAAVGTVLLNHQFNS